MKNIIFLDLDGVLLSYRPEYYFEKTNYGIDLVVLDIFLKIIDKCTIPTKIVLISSFCVPDDAERWFHRYPVLKEKITPYLDPNDNRISSNFISVNRSLGIEDWIGRYGIDVTNVVVIDDSWCSYLTQPITKFHINLIPCITSLGMGWKELRLLDCYLNPIRTSEEQKFIDTYLEHFSMYNPSFLDLKKYWMR